MKPDNGAMRGELTRGALNALFAVGIVLFGAGAWLLLGPRWAIAGVLVGPAIVVTGLVAVRTFTGPGSAALLRTNPPAEAIARLSGEMPGWRTLARLWPGQFRDALASRLMVRSGA